MTSLAVLCVGVGWGLYLYARTPIRLGPLVQRVDTNSFTLIWWDADAKTAEVQARGPEGDVHRAQILHHNQHWHALLVDLAPGVAYTYEISDRDMAGRTTFAETNHVRTAPSSVTSFSFAVVGDSGNGDKRTVGLVERIRGFHPDFMIHTGDLVYKKGTWSDFPLHFFRPFGLLAAEVPIYPALGNHDVMTINGEPFLTTFDLPTNGPTGVENERCYAFTYAGAIVAALDSNAGADDIARVQVPWLERTLADRGDGWRFAFFHHPPYSAGSHGASVEMQQILVPALEAAGVHAVFCGHNHAYIRTAPMRGGDVTTNGGILYVTSGEGGAEKAKPFASMPAYVEASNQGDVSFTLVEIVGDRMRLRQIDDSGRILDDVRMRRTATGLVHDDQG